MVKKVILLGSAALVLVGLLFGREGFSHVKTSLGWVRQSVRESVPVEFEISRARQMIKDLDPEIHRNMHLIAKEEVDVKNLRGQLSDAEKQLVKDIGCRIDVAEKLVHAETTYPGQISLDDQKTSGDITEQITAYFEDSKQAEASVAVKLD